MPQTIECRQLCAATCAYDILANGNFNECVPHYPAVGWMNKPAVHFAGASNMNACLIGVNQSDGIILAFRGTLPPTNLNVGPQLRDWLQDFDANPIPAPSSFPPGVNVHQGFWNSVESLWQKIVPEIKVFLTASPHAKLYVTGHSKGGAMAAIAGARLVFQEGISPAGVYLYAPARAGNSSFVSTYPSSVPVVRYEHYLDLVPFLPPNLNHVNIVSKLPLLMQFFDGVHAWDYTPLGTLQYIEQDGTVIRDKPGLATARELQIIEHAALGGEVDIARAHGPWCKGIFSDGGYMKGVCPAGVCP